MYRYKESTGLPSANDAVQLLLNCNVQTPSSQIFVWKNNHCCLVSSRLIQLPSCIATAHAMHILAHPRMFLVKFESEASILPQVGICEHIFKTNRDTNLPNNCREQVLKRCANSRLDVKPHCHTQERHGNPLIKVMISHASRAEARQSGKSSGHWFAQSPLLSVLHESTHARKKCNTQTIRDGPLAQEANKHIVSSAEDRTYQERDKQTTTTGQTHEQTMRQPWPSTSQTVVVTTW